MSNTIITIERALRDLRAGLSFRLEGHVFAAAETADLTLFQPEALLISAERARTLGLPDAPAVFSCTGTESWISPLINPLLPLPGTLPSAVPFQGPTVEALHIAKYASLLPALYVGKTLYPDILTLSPEAITDYPQALLSSYKRVATARLPLHDIGDVTVVSYRPHHGGLEHLAIIVGDPARMDAPPIRLHSSCLTGDILGSMRCDCGEQFRKAIKDSRDAGGGIVLYLNQEGRGIGLSNKLRAYQLQDTGQDTYDANLLLGYGEDERDFSIAAAMLKDLGISRVQLMTNNPDKIQQLTRHGVHVEKRLSHVISPNGVNDAYLEAKAEKKGHMMKKDTP